MVRPRTDVLSQASLEAFGLFLSLHCELNTPIDDPTTLIRDPGLLVTSELRIIFLVHSQATEPIF
jgi:hypothetical protein